MERCAIKLSRVCAMLSASCLAVAVALLLAPAARANSVWDAVEAKLLTWSNAETSWLENGDLVITYKTGDGTLHLPGYARVWALAVGGGGSGANGKELSSKNGGTGGGGAGGFVEVDTLMMAGGDYKITVGQGGPSPATDKGPGNKGEKSSIVNVATSATVMDEAPGGGAGSIEGEGGSGGSGGGGSEVRQGKMAFPMAGGKPDNDGAYGNSGGAGDCDYLGGGGGGAGGIGTDASQGAAGGLGKSSTITGKEVIYAAGGGGGLVAASGTLVGGVGGSDGIGGRGGDGDVAAMPGREGTGSGGGGGSVKGPGGKGGDGVVIIRISAVADEPIEKPKDNEARIYTGDEIVVYDPKPDVYEITGQNKGTNVNSYVYTVTLAEGFKWSDGDDQPVTAHWKILPDTNSIPTPTFNDVPYDGKNHVVFELPPKPKFEFVAGSVTAATNAGEYSYTVKLLDDVNWRWSDGSITNKTFTWKITRIPVDYPPVPGDDGAFVYDGDWKTAATNSIYYAFSDDSDLKKRDVGDYSFTAILRDNWCWRDKTGPEATNDYSVGWKITQAKNEITALRLADWKLGETPKEPSITAKFGADKVKYTYWNGTEWLSDPPETNGVFSVKAFIPEDADKGNWTSAERTKRFLIYKSFDELFTDYVDLDVPSATPQGIDDYHLLVKISETDLPGFSYERCPTGEGLAFMDLTPGQDEAPLAFDVDTWNVKGDSYVWVKLPRMAANTKIRMYWHLREGMEPPGPDAAETWSGYTGVWHFSEEIDKTAAATTPSADATGHGYAAVPTTESGDLSQMTSQSKAVVGNGRNTAASNDPKGNRLIVTNFTDCALGTNFIFSGWIYLYNSTPPCILARKNLDEEGGFALALNNDDRTKLDLYGRSTNAVVSEEIASKNMNLAWVQLIWAVCGDQYWLYSRSENRGSYSRSGKLASSVGKDLAQLVFGGDIGGKAQSVYGSFDEFRLQPWAISSDGPTPSQIAALTNTINTTYGNVVAPTSFVRHDWIVKDGIKQNYWKKNPSISPTRWESDKVPVVNFGTPATGDVQCVYRNVFKPEETFRTLPTTPGNYVAVFSVTVEGFDDLIHEISFTIVGHEPYSSLGTTETGRILLANDDSRGDWGETSVTNQAYWLKSMDVVTNIIYHPITHVPIGEQIITNYINATYWVHSGNSTHNAEERPYLLTNSVHTLMTTNESPALCGGTRLWHLNQVRIGNLYDESLSEDSRFNNLPWSKTSCAISSNGVAFSQSEIGNMMFRNTTEACIYSPCYTNGIGTIYFDAVNFWATDNPDYLHLVVEVATNVMNSAAIPSDWNLTFANNLEEIEADESVRPDVTTDINYALAEWQAVSVEPRKFINGECTMEPATNVLVLNMTDGGTHVNFYRFVAKLNWDVPTRFRIRRTSSEPSHGHESEEDRDNYAQILLDNIIVSEPNTVKGATAANGWFDREKRGKQVLGYENTWETPFPAIGDSIIARAELGGDGSNCVTKAVMHYRERYLKQRGGSDDFKEVVLNPYDGFKAMKPLELSGLPGDIEFYFTSEIQAPFYRYVDYSADPDKPRDVPGFTEEIPAITNVCTKLDAKTSPSCGSDWFVRLREGRSDWEGLVLRTDVSDAERREIQMELISDHIWRGYFKTVDGIAGGVRYRIEPRNLQKPGTRGFAMNTNYWYAADDVQRPLVSLPVSAILKTDGTTNSWARIPCDGTTGYLMFQVDDSTKSISIVHADYQDFNKWSDANKGSDLFVGNSTEDEGKSGVSPKMQEFTENFTRNGRPWAATPDGGRDGWNEFFDTEASQPFANYVPFGSATTLAGWVCGPGMFVDQWYKHSDAIGGMPRLALQMEGCGKGSIQFPPALTNAPRGLAEVSFTARLGQFIDLDADLAYAEIPSVDTMVTRNYAFVTLAAFDLNSNNDFAGNASLSLFAYYRNRKGAYEVRLEQIGAEIDKVDKSKVTGPSNKRRLTLYRWTPDGSGKITAVKLGEKDITFAAVKTQDERGNYTPMYISCTNEVDATVVKFGIYRNDDGDDKTTAGKGFPFDLQIKELDEKRFYNMVYRDMSDQRLKSGTYGVLSANCDGVFLRPYVSHEPIVTAKSDKDKLVEDGINTKVTFPELVSCKDDIIDEDEEEPWNVNPGRMNTFDHTKETANASEFLWGIEASPVSQTLDLQVSPRGKGKWETVKSFEFADFGKAGQAGTNCSCRLDRTTDLDMRIVVEGELDDPRTDVIIDNLTLTQWRGCDYGDVPDASSFIAPDDGYGWRTNFTFSSGWVKNEVSGGKTNATVLLSAKRTLGWTTGSKASAIRSPLMDGAGTPKRGIGLGLFSFSYRNAQENARLLVQIATNNITSSALGYDTIDDNLWTTVSNINFSAMTPAQRGSGHIDVYLGLHGVKGLMRVCVDPEVVEQVSPTNWLDATQYGEVEITSVYCRDEPALDQTAWWGWNLQTTDHPDRQYLVDNAMFPSGANGLSLGLNRGIENVYDVTNNIETYKRQMPFVQTPTFEQNAVGEITFRARQYELTGQSQYAEVALYGANFRPGTHDLDWHCSPADPPLARFVVSNTTYTTYTYKTKPGEDYKAFRLGVTGIKDVDYETRGPKPTQGETPVRILIDEVLVSEAIYPKMGFRSCLPIRSQLTTSEKVLTAGLREEQPIMGDAWSVQAEIEVKLLPDEIDLRTPGHEPRVFFHWFRGESPWGFAAWKDKPTDPVDKNKRGTAELKRVEGEEMVFKGSYVDAPGAVVMAEPSTATYTYRIYQYAAEVVYWDIKGNCITSGLNRVEWTRPEWYAPLDLNAKYGGGGENDPFAAYNILESVSPGRAWINEANLFDGRTANNTYPASDRQYVEIAVPITQSLENWKLYYVDNHMATNLLCIFGTKQVAKSKTVNSTNDYVFLTVESPAAKKAGTLDAAKGEVDGAWNTLGASDTKGLGELDQTHPIGLQLIRPSGIIAQEIGLEGTNTYASMGAYAERYSLARQVEKMNAEDPEKLWYAVGNEYAGLETLSLGVTNLDVSAVRASAITPKEMWWNRGVKTPGRVNAGQVIPEGYAIFPSGDMVLVNATVTGAHILQTVGEVTNSTLSVLVATPKDGEGTNITYRLDSPWFEVGEIRENGILKAEGGSDGFVFAAGKGTSESVVTVTASARPRKDLREKYGLGPDNPYTDAVLKWLEDGKTLNGKEFAYRGNIDLPIYRHWWSGNVVTNLTLTETYWFDIDPTGSNWCYRAGTSKCPHPVYVNLPGDIIKTNIRIEVAMVITNESTGSSWSPYVLRSKTPGVDSQMYARGETNRWDSVNFKITADVLNGMPLRQKWVPLRYFVFKEGSFDANNRATIDIPHPFSADSLSVNYGWKSYSANPTNEWSLGYRWSIDSRIAPVAIEILAPTNAITW